MQTTSQHATNSEMERALEHLLAAPQDKTILQLIVVRPEKDQRQVVAEAELSPTGGICGDRWISDHWKQRPDGTSDPQAQVSLMNARVLELIAGDSEAMSLAGDNLIVDMDLSESNLPAGSKLAIGDDVVLELTAVPHTGCKKFEHRYGRAALEFVNGKVGSIHNFRGRYARIVESGRIAVGDVVRKILNRNYSVTNAPVRVWHFLQKNVERPVCTIRVILLVAQRGHDWPTRLYTRW